MKHSDMEEQEDYPAEEYFQCYNLDKLLKGIYKNTGVLKGAKQALLYNILECCGRIIGQEYWMIEACGSEESPDDTCSHLLIKALGKKGLDIAIDEISDAFAEARIGGAYFGLPTRVHRKSAATKLGISKTNMIQLEKKDHDKLVRERE